MKVLHLTLKKKWFDMILSGEKKEEYRDVKPYWINRLLWHEYHKMNSIEMFAVLAKKESFRKDFDVVEFRNGYSKDAPMMQVEMIGIHYGFPQKLEWANEPYGKWYFVIELGKIISTKNIKP